jgi:hypothetical protein
MIKAWVAAYKMRQKKATAVGYWHVIYVEVKRMNKSKACCATYQLYVANHAFDMNVVSTWC